MAALSSDTNLFLWVDLEKPAPEEAKFVLEEVFHFHPLPIEDCVRVGPLPKVEEYSPKEEDRFAPCIFTLIQAVDYSPKDGVFATSELNFSWGKISSYRITKFHSAALPSPRSKPPAAQLISPARRIRSPRRCVIPSWTTFKPALDELSLEISELEQQALRHPPKETLNKILQVKKEVLHLRKIIGPQGEVPARFAHGEIELIRAHMVPNYRNVLRRALPNLRSCPGRHRLTNRPFTGLPQYVIEPDR